MGHMYRDKNGKLHYKSDGQIRSEGACLVFLGMLIALLIVAIFKLAIGL